MYIMPAVSWTYVRVEEEHGDLVKFKVCLLNASIHHTRCAHNQNLFFF
jgi:hypothetical protein